MPEFSGYHAANEYYKTKEKKNKKSLNSIFLAFDVVEWNCAKINCIYCVP